MERQWQAEGGDRGVGVGDSGCGDLVVATERG